MNKILTFNQTVREAIAVALIQLMEKKTFAQITISEIAKKAGVSRSSIYRNFDSKEQILTDYVEDLYHKYFETENIMKHFPDRSEMRDFLMPRFSFVKAHQSLFSTLYNSNMLFYVFEKMDPNLVLLLSGQSPSISSYYISMFSGSYSAILAQWIRTGFKETKEEMVEIFSSYPS